MQADLQDVSKVFASGTVNQIVILKIHSKGRAGVTPCVQS